MTYALLLAASVGGLVALPRTSVGDSQLLVVGLLSAFAAAEYVAARAIWRIWVFDMGMALCVIALIAAGPLAAFAVLLVPDAIHLARRRRAFWNVGLAANISSYAAAVSAGAGILALPDVGGDAPAIVLASTVMVLVNYVLARLVLVVVRDRQPVLASAQAELLSILSIHAVVIAITTVTALAVPEIGITALAAFAGLAYLPQVVVGELLRAPSVAGLSVDDAATTYRAALVDELGLARRDRRLIEQVAALAAGRLERLGEVPNPMAIMSDALEVQICLATARTQRDYHASDRAQIVLCAQRWAELTARCTPAFSHEEALVELQRAPVADDAPDAIAVALAIVEREQAFSEHIAGAPRLHRVPGPRILRRRYLPAALALLAA